MINKNYIFYLVISVDLRHIDYGRILGTLLPSPLAVWACCGRGFGRGHVVCTTQFNDMLIVNCNCLTYLAVHL